MNEAITLNTRQKNILNLLAQHPNLSRTQINDKLSPLYPVSKATLARDLNLLNSKKLITSKGKGPSIIYTPTKSHPLLAFTDLSQYFAIEPDDRIEAKKTYSLNIYKHLSNLINKSEASKLKAIYKSYTKTTANLHPNLLKRELERYIIELSWKSSKIEGNTYTLLETEALLKQGVRAIGRSKEEVQMILNHKDTFNAILNHKKSFKKLSLSLILELHNTLIKNLDIDTGIRKQSVGITGTSYRPLSNHSQIKENLSKIIKSINQAQYPLEKALIANSMIAYLQPFLDGNKRTGRMLGNAILLAHDYFPLSYRSVNETKYKQALILFYETNNLYHLKKIFINQYKFALKNYFA